MPSTRLCQFSWPRPQLDRRSAALTLVAMLPVLLAIVRGLISHRVPLGDNGLITLRANDTFTANHPWFGTWTSASLTAGIDFNNPSPLHFQALALFVKPLGIISGSVIGAGSLNLAAIWVAVRHGRHFDGRRGEALFAVAATGLSWSMGSEMLVDVWQPHSLVLPFLAFLATVVAVAAGRWRSLPWAVGIGSLVMGAHLSFTYVVLGLLAAGAVVCWLMDRRRSGGMQAGAAGWRRGLVATLVVGFLCWLQPLLEQLFGPGEGNLSRVLDASSGADKPLGAGLASRLVAQVVVLPPWWLRSSFTDSVQPTPYSVDGSLRPAGLVGPAGAAAAMAVFFGVVGWLLWLCWRRRQRAAFVLLLVTTVAVLLALATATVMPAGVLGLAPHQVRWLWPIALLTMLAVGNAVQCLFLQTLVPPARRRMAAYALVAVLALLAVPAKDSDLGPSASRSSNEAIHSLMNQLEGVQLPGPAYFDGSTLQFAEPYSGPVLAALTDAGQPIRAGDPGFARQLGEHRHRRNDEQWSIQLRVGATELADGEQVVASATAPDGTQVAVVLIDLTVTGG